MFEVNISMVCAIRPKCSCRVSDRRWLQAGVAFVYTVPLPNRLSYARPLIYGIRASAKAQFGHSRLQQLVAFGIQYAVLTNHLGIHHGVAMNEFAVLEPFVLDGSCFENPFAHGCRTLAGLRVAQLFIRHSFYLALNIYTIQQRPTNLTHIPMHLSRSTGARMGRIILPVMPARTRVHRCYEHKRSRIIYRLFGSCHSDMPILQRLPHHFQHRTFILRELIKKQHPVVGQTYLSGMRI